MLAVVGCLFTADVQRSLVSYHTALIGVCTVDGCWLTNREFHVCFIVCMVTIETGNCTDFSHEGLTNHVVLKVSFSPEQTLTS